MRPLLLIYIILVLTGFGCAKAGPAPIAGFIDPDRIQAGKHIPFHRAWRDPDFNYKNYDEIYVGTVNTNYLLEMDWWEEFGRGLHLEDDLDYLAEFTKEELQRAFRLDERKNFRIVDKPGPKTLILEFALTEIVPNKAVLESLTYGTMPMGVGFTLGGSALRMTSRSSVAFEARFRDGANGQVIAMFADREMEKGALFNIKNFTWYGHAKVIIHEWAGQLVKVITKSPRQSVSDSPAWQWKPW